MATFTIYLLRSTIKTAQDAVVDDAAVHVIADGESDYGKLFVKPRPAKPPKWAKLFEPYIDRSHLGTVQSSAAVFIVSAAGRLFALTFGHGRFIIRQDAYEERFGLLVTLNSVKPDALRSIDKRTFVDDQNSRVQTSQASAALDFGVDIERDLIRGIVGYPDKNSAWGRRLAGADSLTVTVDAAVPDLKRMLRRYLKAFESKKYQTRFPWVDQVRQLRSKGELVDRLNGLLVQKLQTAWGAGGLVDDCWLAVPDIVDWDVVTGFKFTRQPSEGTANDLDLPGLVNAYPKISPTVDFLRSHYAMSVDAEETPVDSWLLYKCIHCEIDVDSKSYILSAGNWFEVDKNFSDSVVEAVAQIPMYGSALPVYNHKNEEAYNAAVVTDSAGRFCLMDKKLLRVGGVHNKVEFCDIYGDRVLIHVKHYGSSAVLGHLFNQGLVSGDLLKTNKDYARLANEKLDKSHQLALDESTPRELSSYTVVFAVISVSKKPGLHLPFFAKVVLKSVYTHLRAMGYGEVMLAKIETHPDVLINKLLPQEPRRRRRKRT